jgi:uncharacterized protein
MNKKVVRYFDDNTSLEKKEVYFVDELGYKQGKMISYYRNGKIFQVSNYHYNFLEGEYLRYDPEGNLVREGFFVDNKKCGIFRGYDSDGNITTVEYYINGKECEETEFKKYLAKKRLE